MLSATGECDTTSAAASAICNCAAGDAGGERWAPPPAEPTTSGRQVLHVEEQAAGAAPRRHLALTLLGNLARFLAVLAADGEGEGAQPLLADLLATLEAVAVGTLVEAQQRIVDLV